MRRGFTLLELLVTASLLVMLTAGGLAALSAGTRAAEKTKRVDAMTGEAQAALELLCANLARAVKRGEFCMIALDAQRDGNDTDTLDLLAEGAPQYDRSEGTYRGYCEVGFSIGNGEEEGQRGLVRREDGTADEDPLEGGTMLPVAPQVTGLNLEFYNGLEWSGGWNTPKEFPLAIRITVTVVDEDEKETPRQISTVYALPAR